MINEIYGKSAKINELVEYQENAIVSKIILKQKEGNVTLFAFWAGQELSEHTAPFDALVLCLDGSAIIGIDGAENLIQSGDIILLPANHPHFVKAKTNFKMLLIMIKSSKDLLQLKVQS